MTSSLGFIDYVQYGKYLQFHNEGIVIQDTKLVEELKRGNLRRKIGIIFQEFNKYQLTCREDIGFGNIDLIDNDEKLWESVDKTYNTEMINSFPEGIDTQLGVWFNNGIQLSGGQW